MLAALNKNQRNRASGATSADKPKDAARKGDTKILGNASPAHTLRLALSMNPCVGNRVTATAARAVLAIARAAIEQATQKARFRLKKTSANPVGIVETTPKTARKRRLSPKSNMAA